MALLMSLCPFQLGEVYKEGHYFFSIHIYIEKGCTGFLFTLETSGMLWLISDFAGGLLGDLWGFILPLAPQLKRLGSGNFNKDTLF